MTVGELIRYLQDHDEDAEVRTASQPSWPFEYEVAGVVASEEVPVETEDDPNAKLDEGVVYLVEGAQLAYASKAIWGAAGLS
jgi:hypothetical protein